VRSWRKRGRHRNSETRSAGPAGRVATAAAALALCCAMASCGSVWGLSTSDNTSVGAGHEELGGGTVSGGDVQDPGDLANSRLKLGLGGRGELELNLFANMSRPVGSGRLMGYMALQGDSAEELGSVAGQWGLAMPRAQRLGGAAADQASSYRLSYRTGALALGGSFLDVGSGFALPGGTAGRSSEGEAQMLAEALGTRRVELSAALGLAPGASLTSRHESVRNERPGDKNRGLTTTDIGHTLSWGVGPRSQLTASLGEHSERWSEAVGKADVRRRETAVEFKSEFGRDGRHGLRLGLTSKETRKGDSEQSEQVREAHLGLAATTRLRLNADYVSNGSKEGADRTTQTVGAVMQLASDSHLSAAVKRLSVGDNRSGTESLLKLSAKLGGGASAGTLEGEECTGRGEALDFSRRRKWMLTGVLGDGRGRTSLRANLEEKRGEGPSGLLQRTALVHLDRALWSGVRLTADRHEQVGGTAAEPEVTVRSSCGVEARLGSSAALNLGLVSEKKPQGTKNRSVRVALEQEVRGLKLRAERRSWRSEGEKQSELSCGVDAPSGDLADWAKEISGAHEFAEAGEYLVREAPGWAEMPFAGYRLWASRRSARNAGGLDTMVFAHRRMVGDGLHLRVTHEECPEGKEGESKGRPLPLRRERVEVGLPLGEGLVARASYRTESGVSAERGRGDGFTLGLWGRLSEREGMEASVSHDGGRWGGEVRRHTSVSVLYSLKVSDDHRLHVKAGYGWDDPETGNRQRESRISLGYAKPI